MLPSGRNSGRSVVMSVPHIIDSAAWIAAPQSVRVTGEDLAVNADKAQFALTNQHGFELASRNPRPLNPHLADAVEHGVVLFVRTALRSIALTTNENRSGGLAQPRRVGLPQTNKFLTARLLAPWESYLSAINSPT